MISEYNKVTKRPSIQTQVEADACYFALQKTEYEQSWNKKEEKAFWYFVDYVHRLRLKSMSDVDVDFVNTLRLNIIRTYFEGCLNNNMLFNLSETVNEFLEEFTDRSFTPLFYDEEIYDLTQERRKLSVFNFDAFDDMLHELRYMQLHTEAALLEVVRYLGLTLKEAMFLNASLSIDYALKNEHIVIRNQDPSRVRRVKIWNVDQMLALTRLATNRLINDPDEHYREKRYAYLFSPLSQVHKHLFNKSLSIYALRKAYFDEEFYRGANAEMNNSNIVSRAFEVSMNMGHSFCFDESMLLKNSIEENKLAEFNSIPEQSPHKFLVPESIKNYISAHYRKKRNF